MESDIWQVSDTAEDVSAKVMELGTPQGEFAVGQARFLRQVVGALLLVPLGLALILLPVAMIWWQPGGHQGFWFFKLAAIGFIFLSGSVFLAVRAYRNRGLRVLVFPEGLVRLHREQAQAVLWDEIEQFWQKRPSTSWARMSQGKLLFTVKRRDGTELTFDDSLPELPRLGGLIERETLRHLLARARATLNEGQAVSFGKLRAYRRGLHNGREMAVWAQLKPPRVEMDRFFLDKQGHWLPWHNGSLSETPNFHVLQALLREQSANAPTSNGTS